MRLPRYADQANYKLGRPMADRCNQELLSARERPQVEEATEPNAVRRARKAVSSVRDIAMSDPGPVYSVFLAALKFGGRSDTEERLQRDGQDAYEMKIMGSQMAVATTFEELEHLLNLIERAKTLQEVRALLKLYVISWATLSDVVAVLINHVYDLGYGAPDVSFGSILRNEHVKKTAIPAIVKRHAAAVRHEYYIRLRNDVVHRGTLIDAEFDSLQCKWLAAAAMRLVRLPSRDPAQEETQLRAAAAELGVHEKLKDLIATKRQQLHAHLMATRVLLQEVSSELVVEIDRRRTAA